MKKLFMMLAVLGALWTVTGCNTVAGAGKDVEKAGDAVQDVAK